MITRIVLLLLVAALAMPTVSLRPPVESGGPGWSEVAQAAGGQKNKKKQRPQKSKTVSRTVRGPLKQTILSTETITIPAGDPVTTKGDAAPYPSVIDVSGFVNGVITDVDLVLLDVTHKVPEDIDIMLSKDDGRRALVMSDVGRIFKIANIDLTLDDEAGSPLPQTELASGAFRPTNIDAVGQEPDAFSAPAPALDGNVALSTFDGANPNGTWRLFVTDDATGDTGAIAGWALRITAEVDLTTVSEQSAGGKDGKKGNTGPKKRKKGGRRGSR